eukprot:GGOE01023476.1.p1 GENE.GGOE01023476.1~~GGOE01023476.1.p1  ORF type:complete len:560 (-),score=152.39 GGOE01023476.1:257-1759(-)
MDKEHVFKCISSMTYLTPRARQHPLYQEVLAAARASGASYRLLDVGTCFGQETRALIADGVPAACLTVTDIHDRYWNAGLRLFMDDRERPTGHHITGVTTVFGDWSTDPAVADIAHEMNERFDAVLCMMVLHVLSAMQVERLLARLARVLKPGGVLIGSSLGAPTAREWGPTPDGSANRWLHDRETLAATLQAAGFDGEVTVEEVPGLPQGFSSTLPDRKFLRFTARKMREIRDEELVFLQQWLGDDSFTLEALRDHVRSAHQAVASQTYKCICMMTYLTPRARRHPAYPRVLAAARTAGAAFRLLDVGTCFGQDTRALIVDGVPAACLTVTDIHDRYWNAGLRLFMDDRERPTGHHITGVTTVFGDWSTDPAVADIAHEMNERFDAVLCMMVLHVLSAVQVERLLARLARVLKPGGVLFGSSLGAATAGERVPTPDGTANRWLHSKQTLTATLQAAGFTGPVSVAEVPRESLAAMPAAIAHVLADRLVLGFAAEKAAVV